MFNDHRSVQLLPNQRSVAQLPNLNEMRNRKDDIALSLKYSIRKLYKDYELSNHY